MVQRAVHSRYSRNISLIGYSGQEILLDAKVLVVGAGGIGSPLLYYLAASGVGTIGIIDPDVVSLSDLQRQILYNSDVINKFKVDHASDILNKLNPDCNIITYRCSIGKGNVNIINDFDLVAECSDNFETKFLLNRECYLRKKALILGAVIGYKGYVGSFKPYLNFKYPCYQCFCPNIPNEKSLQSCELHGVLSSVVGTVGSIQATHVIKELLHIGDMVPNKLIKINLDNFSSSIIEKDPKCNICSMN